MKSVVDIIFNILSIIIPFFAFWKWGEARAEKKYAEKIAKEKVEDAKISSEPFIDRPLSGMRDKKD